MEKVLVKILSNLIVIFLGSYIFIFNFSSEFYWLYGELIIKVINKF